MRQSAREYAWVKPLLYWFDKNKAPLPWRSRPTPYRVWISEIMLQQTQIPTVIPYFLRFMTRFPSMRRLAEADLQELLKVWEGLGYYSRARNLHRAAQQVVEECRGRLPRDSAELQKLPGIGEYTAAAIASIAFGEVAPVVDGNVVRVMTRLRGIAIESRKPQLKRMIHDDLAACIPTARPGDFNQALMELGQVVCRPGNPLCKPCPIRRWCKAFQMNQTDRFPVRTKRKPVPHYDVVACVIRKGGKVLISRRRADQMLGGLWEFPGGKCEPGESLEAAAIREIDEEIGIRIRPGKVLCVVKHAYSHFKITLHAMDCRVLGGRAKAKESDEVLWTPVSRLKDYPFPAGDRKIIDTLGRLNA